MDRKIERMNDLLCPHVMSCFTMQFFQQGKIIWTYIYRCFCFSSAEEPFLILADHHEIRKLSVDGSNYTLLKQVRLSLSFSFFSASFVAK